jgi:hypothetical protein
MAHTAKKHSVAAIVVGLIPLAQTLKVYTYMLEWLELTTQRGGVKFLPIGIQCTQLVGCQYTNEIMLSICDFAKKNFSNPSLVICFFATPLIKFETNIANRRETSNNSKSPRQIIMIDQSETGIRSQIIFIT